MTNNRQFNKMYRDLLGNGLKGDEIVAITVIYDRMYSSITRNDFFDKKMQKHYVIYTRKELANDVTVTQKTAGNIINKLVDLGYLTKKKQFSKADKLFIPDFNEEMALAELAEREVSNDSMSVEITPLQGKNLHSNQTDLNQTNTLTNNTVNTEKTEKSKEVVQVAKDSFDIQSWIDSTVKGYAIDRCVPESIAKYASHFKNIFADANSFCSDTMKLISNVRTHIVNKFGIANTEKSQFDTNANFGYKLGEKLRSVFQHVKLTNIKDSKDFMKYLNKSLQEFFKEATGNAVAIARPAYAPAMESNNTQQSTNTNKPSALVQPDWLDEPEDSWKTNQPEVTEEDRRRVKEMLKHFS